MQQAKNLLFKLRCASCFEEVHVTSHDIVCKCGGLIEAEYDITSIGDWRKSNGLKYSKLLPIQDPSHAMDYAAYFNAPTPLYKSEKLGKYLGLKGLWLKDETKNFTGTFKARDALVSLLRFQEINLLEFVLCSTGNTAAAFCFAMGLAKNLMVAHLFFPKGTIIDFTIPPNLTSKVQFVDGTYQDAIKAAKEFSRKTGIPYEGGFANLGRREGCKTLALEIAESELQPDLYVQAIGSGTGAYAFHKGYSELRKLGAVRTIPRILCVQPERCSPIVDSFKEGSNSLDPKFVVNRPDSFATTLSNGNPAFSYPYVRKAVLDSKGYMEKVSETEIGRALVLLLVLEGLACDPAAAVALAGLIKCVRDGEVDADSTIVLNVSGGLRRSGSPNMINAPVNAERSS